MSNSPRAFVQQLNHVRKPATNSYELFIKEYKKHHFTSFPVMILLSIEEMHQLVKEHHGTIQ